MRQFSVSSTINTLNSFNDFQCSYLSQQIIVMIIELEQQVSFVILLYIAVSIILIHDF